MNGPRCDYCRHYNHHGADFCEACEFPLAVAHAAGEPASWRPPVVDIPAPPFKNMGDVLSPTLAVFRKHFTLVGIFVLLATVPEALVRYSVVDFTRAGGALALAGTNVFGSQGGLLWQLVSMAGTSLLSGSLVYAVVDLQRAGRASAGECLSRGLSAWPKVFLLTLLYTLIIRAGYALLIVPGVILSLMFAVCVPAAVVEGLGPVAALKRSCELTKGYRGRIFITTFLWGLLILVLNWFLTRSFAGGAQLDLLPTLLTQTAVLGMLNASAHVLTVYVYLGLLRERGSRSQADAFAHGARAAG
jgi:uncharacterized membrane protein